MMIIFLRVPIKFNVHQLIFQFHQDNDSGDLIIVQNILRTNQIYSFLYCARWSKHQHYLFEKESLRYIGQIRVPSHNDYSSTNPLSRQHFQSLAGRGSTESAKGKINSFCDEKPEQALYSIAGCLQVQKTADIQAKYFDESS